MWGDSMPDYKAVNDLFYSFRSDFEAIVMDMIGEKIDKRTLDIMFEDFDSLQEEYHNRIKDFYRKDEEDEFI